MPCPVHLPDGYSVASEPADLDELVGLIRRSELSTKGSSTTTAESTSARFGQAAVDANTDSLMIRSSTGAICAAAIHEAREHNIRSMVSGWVEPTLVGMGLGSTLVEWAVLRARERIPRAPADARLTVTARIDDRNLRAIDLMKAHGFTATRSFFEMRGPVDGAAHATPMPGHLALRTLDSDDDLVGLTHVATEAFRGTYGFIDTPEDGHLERWRRRRRRSDWDDSLVWLAEFGDQIVAIAVCLASNGPRTDEGYVVTLGVLPAWRGVGVARSLLTTAMDEYSLRGYRAVSLHVDGMNATGALQLYRSVGMLPVATETEFELELRPGQDLVAR
jgi:mycothiol synthase